jgi:subtilisin-like proprotein convertase family protein
MYVHNPFYQLKYQPKMKKTLLFIIAIILFANLSFGQSNFWTKTSENKLKSIEKMDRGVSPSKYQLFQLDYNAFKQLLLSAPMENTTLSSNLIVQFPDFEGNLKSFKVFEAPVMEKELSDKFPSIRTYSAQGIDDPTSTLRFSITHFGLHVMSISGKMGTYYIDTHTKDLNNYIVYSRKDVQKARSFGCFVQDNESSILDKNLVTNQRVNDGNLRQYRLAISNTIEYAAYHLNAAGTSAGASLAVKKGVVLSAMVVSLTRLNGIYERDMSLRMNLVANNDLVIFIDSDSYTNSPEMLNEIQPIVDGLIGPANYDMGHGYCTTDSGIAQVSSVCGSGKARGITGNPAPVGDPFDVDYVAHEMGHQFGASHTQNNNCNRSAASAYEPGSASTILGYAGICAPNVQTNSDAHFHARSILQMTSFVTSGAASCRAISANGNIAPVVNAGANFTIPNGTAFVLKGAATDANGDALTYCWEQYNNEVTTQPPLQTATTGPNFKSLPPTTSPNRYMPAFSDVLNGNLAPTWEVVPSVARSMTFALTVRDNRAGGGMTNRGDMTVTTANVGPFRVTSPVVAASWDTGSIQTITWDVAGTTANGINTVNVNILISTDGGATFSTLVANTPNDGLQSVTMPSTAAVNCRILVEAVGNIFYAVSPNFSVGYTIQTICNTYSNNTIQNIPDGPSPTVSIAGPTLTSVINIPISQTITDVNVNVNVTHQWIRDLVSRVVHPDGTVVILGNRICNDQDGYNITFNDGSPAIVCSAPLTSGTFSSNEPLSALNSKTTNGNWSLTMNDYFQGDIGTLNSWSVEVCYTQATLTSENFGLENFTLYPNPNNGNFNIQFNSNSGNEIKINVHDIRGRAIYSKSYTNIGLFYENLQLSNVQSGVYLVTVQDGSRKEIKKIMIK